MADSGHQPSREVEAARAWHAAQRGINRNPRDRLSFLAGYLACASSVQRMEDELEFYREQARQEQDSGADVIDL